MTLAAMVMEIQDQRPLEALVDGGRNGDVHAGVHLRVHEFDGGHRSVQRKLLVLHHATDQVRPRVPRASP